MKTLVIGLGNPILTDDGVGIYAARLVDELRPPDSTIDVLELSVGGLSLMEAMIGYDRVILVDSMWTPDGTVGEVIQFDAGVFAETLNTSSAHDVDLSTALVVGRSLKAELPCDYNVQIVGVQAREVLTFGERPTPPVEAAIPHAARAVLDLLGYKDIVIPKTITIDHRRIL